MNPIIYFVLAQKNLQALAANPPIDLGDLLPIVIIPSLCLMAGWLAWALTRTKHLKAKARIELHNKLLEKIGSAQEIIQLIGTEDGRRFLEAIAEDRATPQEEILESIQRGIICSMIGLGGLLLRLIFPQGYGVFILASLMIGIVGIGFLISSAIFWRLSKSWGLLSPAKSNRANDRPRNRSLFD